MNKTDFSSFEVGTVFNDVSLSHELRPETSSVTVSYPSRLEAMALDPSKIADNTNLVYEAGQIDFSVALYKHISVSLSDSHDQIAISDRTSRKSLVRHAALIMRHAMGIKHGLDIDVEDDVDLRHCGLGSSSSLIAGTAAAINELYGKPIAPLDLVRFTAQNHGEEIDEDDSKLVPVQCIGGSAVCGHFEGGAIILAGQATPIFSTQIPEDLKVVIGIPIDFDHPDSQQLMQAEIDNIEGFKDSGERYGNEIAHRLLHKVMPDMARGSLKECKDLIFDYRWDMGSIANCSFVYPRLNEIADKLRWTKDDSDIEIISLSSVGPGFFCLTQNVDKVHDAFQDLGLTTHETSIHNGTYGVQKND